MFYIILKGKVKIKKTTDILVTKTLEEYFQILMDLKDKNDIYLLKQNIKANKNVFNVNFQDVRYLKKIYQTIIYNRLSKESKIYKKKVIENKDNTSQDNSVEHNTSILLKESTFTTDSAFKSKLVDSINLNSDVANNNPSPSKRHIKIKLQNNQNQDRTKSKFYNENTFSKYMIKNFSEDLQIMPKISNNSCKLGDDQAQQIDKQDNESGYPLLNNDNLITNDDKSDTKYLKKINSKKQIKSQKSGIIKTTIDPFQKTVNLEDYMYIKNCHEPKQIKLYIYKDFMDLNTGSIFGEILEKPNAVR